AFNQHSLSPEIYQIEEVTLRSFTRLLIAIPVLCLAASSTAFAAGFSIFEQGAKATGMGGAFAATADDPSAIFYNVAGLAQQRHTAFSIGGTFINFSNEFVGDPNDAFSSGARGFYKHHTFVPPNAYAVVPLGGNFLSSSWKSGTTWNAGVLLKPGTWRIGAAYRGDMDLKFDGDLTVTQIPTCIAPFDALVKAGLPPNQGVKTTIPFPAVASLGIATTAIPNWD